MTPEEFKVFNEINQRNIIRGKIKALSFRLLICLDDERQEIEEELVCLRLN